MCLAWTLVTKGNYSISCGVRVWCYSADILWRKHWIGPGKVYLKNQQLVYNGFIADLLSCWNKEQACNQRSHMTFWHDTMQFGRWVQDLGGTCSTFKVGTSLKMDTASSFEMLIPTYRPRGNTSQKTVIFTFTAMRTNLTWDTFLTHFTRMHLTAYSWMKPR
jgi:hypothetical protein